jgi:PAT family beta-lactamase induction signal transducer AmpG
VGRVRRILVLSALYLAQGMPFGLQANALPAYLREAGLSLTTIGLAGVLAVPWMLKPLWAPIVDRWFERRRWIQVLLGLLALLSLVGSQLALDDIRVLALLVLLMNALAATQDIAVDGLAVDILAEDELGPGNAAQVVGYKLGMILGGGVLVALAGPAKLPGLFLWMAGAFVLVLLLALTLPGGDATAEPNLSLFAILRRLFGSLALPGAVWLYAVVGTYKLGETLIDAMYKPFLVDLGYSAERIGVLAGTYGMIASVAGSICGGALARYRPVLTAVAIAATLRVFPLAAEWWMTTGAPSELAVATITAAEHFFGGLLTTTVFALMMSRVDPRIGATHFTLLAAVEVWGKLPVGAASGVLADRVGYTTAFGLGVGLSVAFLALLLPLSRTRSA